MEMPADEPVRWMQPVTEYIPDLPEITGSEPEVAAMTERTTIHCRSANLLSGVALTITPTDPTCETYYVSFDLVSGSPAAGTTAVTAKAMAARNPSSTCLPARR